MDQDDTRFDLIVIGGGAAGFFGAINAAVLKPALKILILEKSNKLLTKVRISGGGRCNVTHRPLSPASLSKHYPRGGRELKKLFQTFSAADTVRWFESRGVELKIESDGRMFPVSDSSSSIVNCLLNEASKVGVSVLQSHEVTQIVRAKFGFAVVAGNKSFSCDKVLVTSGGSPKSAGYQHIVGTGFKIIEPIPSLFTFNDSEKKFKDLMGLSVRNASVKIEGTKFQQEGPVLITHWGLSGPAVIKLSAWAAEYLHKCQYDFKVFVNWTGGISEDDVRNILLQLGSDNPKQRISAHNLFDIPTRLWQRLCTLADIADTKTWNDIPQRGLNRLIEYLVRTPFKIRGKTTFKEEFVTCGGIDLSDIDLPTMMSKRHAGMYFAGEVLNIDGETGGFNFQAAWTTAYVAARSIAAD